MGGAYETRRSFSLKYEKNAILQLVLGLLVTYIIMQSLYIIVLVVSANQHNILHGVMIPNIGLQPFHDFIFRPWTLITYSLGHIGFFEMATNLAWLYLFGNIIQNLLGYKDVVPLYFFSTIVGGLIYLLLSYVGVKVPGSYYLVGSYPANAAFAIAAVTLAPNYKVSLNDQIKFSIWIPFIIFWALLLTLLIPSQNINMLLLVVIGGALGFIYMILVKNGFSIGKYLYKFWEGTNKAFSPNENNSNQGHRTHVLSHKKDDEIRIINTILDKINESGITSLTQKEKEILEHWKNNNR